MARHDSVDWFARVAQIPDGIHSEDSHSVGTGDAGTHRMNELALELDGFSGVVHHGLFGDFRKAHFEVL